MYECSIQEKTYVIQPVLGFFMTSYVKWRRLKIIHYACMLNDVGMRSKSHIS